jgi:hypothetical protein
MSKIENFSVEFITETVMGECESIISETENITEELDSTTFASFIDELYEIRSIAEHMQSLVLDYSEETDEYQTNCLLDEMSEESINLYQCIKYSLESFEIDNESINNIEITSSFEFMRHSINTIRSLFV